ncbi:XylR family transcriptional regulator [Gracilibacillus alcaliphilus]|uniref:XylR family transcriptional regulator n=1 Tax=Gracilibacillus alcaliphilus TaxID=1401441 RepID=UPI00195E004E|nr:DNA-binding transcriptional regulator [Gracilibacillus alcaliphilus]MBM7677526.1 LacI family transcriptional regulator [Gracilibacillus alcaliphilus]
MNSKYKKNPNYHVALIIETSNEYARGLLRGIKEYLNENRPWSIYLGEHSRDHTDLSWLKNWKGDGIIARIETKEIASIISEINLPTVDVSADRFLPHLPCVETDNQAIAHMAADHLISKGFKHFGFCGEMQFPWARQRCQFFIDYLKDKGFPCHTFESSRNKSWTKDREDMALWLESLPKPIGIMASYDILGQKLLEACQLANVAVPYQVGVIGVDNDELLCNLSDPSLSSIVPDTLNTGYKAAEILDRMMAGEQVEPELHLFSPMKLFTRVSTDVVTVEDTLVSEAVQIIRNHAYEDIKVEDILKHVLVSRSVLDNRFKKALGRTPHQEIMEIKVNLMKQLLSETDLPLSLIAEKIGFKHVEYMNVLFKRKTGLTPGQYRKFN